METTATILNHFRERLPNLQPSDLEFINGDRFRICSENGVDILPISGRIQSGVVFEDFSFRGK